MIAVLGMKIKDIKDILIKHHEKGICEIANDNADGQVILSGHKEKSKIFKFLREKDKSIHLR